VPEHFLKGLKKDRVGTVEADGDSMNLAGIHHGMLLLVRCDVQPISGNVVVANIPIVGSVCKRYKVEGGEGWLLSESTSHHAPIKMTDDVKITGVVTKAWLVTDL
jgi:SOS-response transcriptional repressor LexA